MFQVLIVCTGNICRSPMAEGILTNLLRTAEPPLSVESAGVAAPEGSPASSHAVAVAKKRGVDIRRHRARQVTRSLLDTVDLVLTMESHHKHEVLAMAPSLEGRVEILTELAGEGPDGVPDPLGGNRETYGETFDRIEELLSRVAPGILEMAKEKASQSTKSPKPTRGEEPTESKKG